MSDVDRFTLEEQIMDCWNVTNDLDTICYAVLEKGATTDDVANMLIGLKALYNAKFDRMFLTFEECIKNGSVN